MCIRNGLMTHVYRPENNADTVFGDIHIQYKFLFSRMDRTLTMRFDEKSFYRYDQFNEMIIPEMEIIMNRQKRKKKKSKIVVLLSK